MVNITFRQIDKNGDKDSKIFYKILKDYFFELDKKSGNESLAEEVLKKYSLGMIKMQGPHDRHLKIIYQGDKVTGFLYGKIDHEDHRGYIKPGYGYIMEFYIVEKFRRVGIGKTAFKHLQKLFGDNGAGKMYLTTHPGAAESFWKTMGFKYLGEISPENKMRIFEKDI